MTTAAAVADRRSFRHDPVAVLTGLQIRAARALLRWSHQRLAQESNIGIATIQRAESEDGVPAVQARTLNRIQNALEQAGVVFLDPGKTDQGGIGVRLKN